MRSKCIAPLILNFVTKSKWVFNLTRPPPRGEGGEEKPVEASWNVMEHAQKPHFVFRRNGRVHLNRRGASVQSTAGSRGVRISGSNAGYTMFRGSVKGTGYPLHSPVSPSLPLPWVTVCHHISTGLYLMNRGLGGTQRRSGHFGISKNSCYDRISCHLL